MLIVLLVYKTNGDVFLPRNVLLCLKIAPMGPCNKSYCKM